MMAPRWRKAVADIAVGPGRSALTVLAMAIGVCALSTLAFKHSIVQPIIENMHGATQPESATFYVDGVDDALVAAVQAVEGVGDAEARPMIMARLRVGAPEADEWIPALLYVIRDFDAQRINLFSPNDGVWPPAPGEILLERSAVQVAGAAREDALTLRIPGAGESTLRFAGTVHAPGLAPAWMEHVVYGFIGWDSMVRASNPRETARLLMRVAEHDLEVGHINEVADRAKVEIESRGRSVRRVDVPEPGRHVHAGQMNTFMLLLGTFAVLAFLLSAVLVASMIHTLQSEQVKQVGMMKAVGATRRQIAGVYLAHVGMLAVVALIVGVPSGWIAGRAYAGFAAGILNADVTRIPFPWATLAAIIVVGVCVPVLAALIPVWRASRISVREALASEPGERDFGHGRFDRWLMAITWLPRPLVLVLRATCAQRGRLALTVGMLAIGGAMFMAALNVSKAWNETTHATFERRHYDLTLQFAHPQPADAVEAVLHALPDVSHTEAWPAAHAYLVGSSGVAGKDVTLLGVHPSSRLLDPKLVSGGWLTTAVPDGVVINHGVVALHPTLSVGDTLAVRRHGRTLEFPIVGIVKELLPQALIYVPRNALLAAANLSSDSLRTVRIVTQEHGAEAERRAARAIEQVYDNAGIEIAALRRKDDTKGAVLDHIVIIQMILTLAAAIVVLVGGIGLASTLTVNVLQRTRDIGVMSALGATPDRLAFQVLCEAVLIGVLSWIVATVATVPISYALGAVTGRMFFKTPLDFTVSWWAAAVWLLLVIVLAALSAFHPARRAARLTVREAITHV